MRDSTRQHKILCQLLKYLPNPCHKKQRVPMPNGKHSQPCDPLRRLEKTEKKGRAVRSWLLERQARRLGTGPLSHRVLGGCRQNIIYTTHMATRWGGFPAMTISIFPPCGSHLMMHKCNQVGIWPKSGLPAPQVIELEIFYIQHLEKFI